jgi:hypothetical protein
MFGAVDFGLPISSKTEGRWKAKGGVVFAADTAQVKRLTSYEMSICHGVLVGQPVERQQDKPCT